MYARPQPYSLTAALITAVGSLLHLTALSRALRQVFRLLLLVPIIWISLLCGNSWADAPQRLLAHPHTPAPYETIQRPHMADHVAFAELGEAEVIEQLGDAQRDTDADPERAPNASCTPPYAALLVRLHPARAPPAALHPRHHIGFEHLLASTRLRTSAPSRAPPRA